MNKSTFVKGVEKLVNPIDVGTLHFIQSFNNMIPKNIQKKMVAASGQKTPYMGFVVEPYSTFLCYEITDLSKAKTFLPKGFKLAKTKVFDSDEEKYYGIFGCFNAHTSGFWGLRIEFYIIAEDEETGLLSWIIADYDTNTITYDPKNGLSDPNASNSLLTIDYEGIIYADVLNQDGRQLVFNTDSTQGKMSPLDQRLWIEGNLSVAYGRKKSDDNPSVFSLIFEPGEFKQGLRIPKDALQLEVNNWFPGLFEEKPSEVLCFPYAQHFLSDSPGHASLLSNEGELNDAVEKIDFNLIDVFSTKSFKKTFLIGGVISFISNATLLTLLLTK
jgi:hypothetical protein